MRQLPSLKNRRMIAVTGKGGSGKTSLVTIMVKLLAKGKNMNILVIDADSAISLPYTLGVKVRKTIGEIRRQIIESPKARTEMENIHIQTVIADTLEAGDGFHLLAMGRPEGPGCYCSVNDLLRYGIERLSRDFDLTIVDCEAGPEQISRRVAQGVDFLIIVTDATVRGIQAASLIKKITQVDEVMKSTRVGLVINRLKQESNFIIETAQQLGLEILGYVPEDENITKYDLVGEPLINLPDTSPSVLAVQGILEKIALF
jgi:CO dehydrogenase maturation factor